MNLENSNNYKGRAVTKLVNEKHLLTNFGEHNHAPCASAAKIRKNATKINMK